MARRGGSTLSVITPTPSSALQRLVADYLQDRRVKCSPKTISIYRDALEEVLLPLCANHGVDRIDQLTERHLNDLTVSLLDGTGSRSGRPLSKHTVHSYIRAVNAFLAWARKDGETVTGKAKLPTLGRRVLDVLSRQEIQALEDAAGVERDKLIVRTLADTGMRLGGLLGLTLNDFRGDGKRVFTLRVHEKGDQERLVPVQPELYRRLHRFAKKTRRESDSDRIFLALRKSRRTGQFEPLEPSGVNQLFHNLAELAGIDKRVYPHLLRHSFATHFLRRGGNPLLLQQILGHESLAMITMNYSHLTQSDAAAALMAVLRSEE
jgi:site-specific recombinase XerD